MKYTYAILFILGMVCSLTAQTRYYVKGDAAGSNNGLSWSNAFNDLQIALQTAQTGDEVWVAEGAYRPTDLSDRTRSFEPKIGTKLYGGFAGNETNLNQRDWTIHPVVLNGDIGTLGDSTDNSLNVMYLFEPDSNTVIDGFVIRNGNADDISSSDPRSRFRSGGGLYIMAASADAYPEIRNCIFERNTAFSFGGGALVNGINDGSAAPRFVHCRFEKNRTLGSGGAIARFGGSILERGVEFQSCTFMQNRAEARGGGLYYSDGPGMDRLDIGDCVFEQNVGVKAGGGVYLVLGRDQGAECLIKGCTFHQNASGGAAAIQTLPLGVATVKTFDIDSCTFTDNRHLNVQAVPDINPSVVWIELISQFGSQSIVSKCKFDQNLAWDIIFASEWGEFAPTQILNTIFSGNIIARAVFKITTAKSIDIHSTVVEGNSGSIYGKLGEFLSNKTRFYNSLFFNNSVDSYYFTNLAHDTLIIDNSIFANNNIPQTGDYAYPKPKYLIVRNSSFQDLANRVKFFYATEYAEIDYSHLDTLECPFYPFYHITCGPNNLIGLDPLFRDTANGDFSLLPCSPLINAGSNAAAADILTDLAGHPRIQDGTVDIGAYESPAFVLAAAPQVQPACSGASNGSIRVHPVFGCEPYTYQWLPAASNGPELNGLPPGNYLLTITDGSGRQIRDTLEVAEAPKPHLNPFSTDVQCANGLGGSLSAGISGGSAPYHYQWAPPAPDTALLNHLPAGAYALTVADAHGCQDSAKAGIALLGMLTPSINGQSISCSGAADGWLSLEAANGAAPFSWNWTGWPGTDSVAQPLGPGQYSVTITDAYGCTASNTFPPMNDPAPITATLDVSDQTNLNMPNGSAIVTSTAGGTPFPGMPPYYQYAWSTGDIGGGIGSLTAGTYTLTITDSHGCTSVQAFEVQLMVGTGEVAGTAMLLYPNPAADWLKLVLPGHSGKLEVEISDASGRVVLKQTLPAVAAECQLDFREMPSGTYQISVRETEGNWVFVGKVVKG